MHRFESDRRNFLGLFEATAFGVGKLGEALTHRLGMIGHAKDLFLPPWADFHNTTALRRTDPFDSAARELGVAGHVE